MIPDRTLQQVSKFLFVILMLLAPLSLRSQQSLLYLFGNGICSRYELVFEDDFNASLDTIKWLTSYPWGRHLTGNTPEEESQEYYTETGNLSFNAGIVSLMAKKEKVCGLSQPWEDSSKVLTNGMKNYRCHDYTSAMLFSNSQFGYGWYEIRFRQSINSKGLWPAFWLYSEGNEIDIFENKGERTNETHWDLHCKEGCRRKNGGWMKLNTDFTRQFNVISLEWNSQGQRWFCNGLNYKAAKQHYSNRMNIIINNAVARNRNGGGFWVGPDATTSFPASLDVDYVRYYKTIYAARKWPKRTSSESALSALLDRSSTELFPSPAKKRKTDTLIALVYDGAKHSVKVTNTSREKAVVYIYNTSKKLLEQTAIDASSDAEITDLPDETLIVVVKNGRKTLADQFNARR